MRRNACSAPKLGRHNAEIFGSLGVSEAEVERLRTKGVVWSGRNIRLIWNRRSAGWC